MSSIALPGLQTGLDTQMLIQQLVAASSRPLNLLQARKARWESKQSAFSALETRLETLQGAVEDIRYVSDLRAYTPTSNKEEILTVEVATGASEGAHEIEINQLAAAEREVHDGLAALETLVGEGVFAYTYNGETRTIQTTAETTLEDLRDLINHDGGNPGITASILEYDAGGDQVYHLVLGGNDTGADYTIAIDDGLTTLNGGGGTVDFRQATFIETQSARDAQVRVDGYPSGEWITRSTNTIDDILPGVTLNLHSTTGADETVHISLTRDTEGLKQKITDFVDSYNAVVEYVQEKTAYDEATKTAGILMGEYSTTHVRRVLRLPLIEAALGFKDGSDAYTLAAQIGLSVDRNGKLELDDDTFDEALADDYLGLLSLLGTDHTGASDSDNLKFYSAANMTEPGTYDVKAVFDAGTLVSAQIKLAGEGEGAWRAADVEDNVIIGAEGYPEHFLQITATYSGSGEITAEVRVRQGVVGRLYEVLDDLLDSTDGTLAFVEKRCTNAIEGIDDNIERQQDRLQRMEAALRAKFARLERALTLLEAQRGALGMVLL